MAIYDLFSKRQKRIRGEITDVYVYDNIPQKFRVQFNQIINDIIGQCSNFIEMKHYNYIPDIYDNIYRDICEILRKEYGEFKLANNVISYKDEIFEHFHKTPFSDHCLDVIELFCGAIKYTVGEKSLTLREKANNAISDINARFRESGIGYQYENKEIIRVDSQFIHSEVVKPTLSLLSANGEYNGVIDEFLAAHEHYRLDNFKECLNECLKSFESIMKAIHDKRSWQYNKNDTASKLINSCLEHELIPSYLQGQFTSLKTMLESGIPTIRNKNSGHGQGTDVTTVPRELVSYMLHLTATNLLFLAQSEQSL